MVASAAPDDRTLVMVHTFDATPARVFAAWTDPGQFVEWFGPPGMKNTHCRFDLRVGGTWEFQLGQSRYLVGDDATAADLFLAPIVFTFPARTPNQSLNL